MLLAVFNIRESYNKEQFKQDFLNKNNYVDSTELLTCFLRRCTKKHALVPFDLMNRIQAADLEFDLAVEEPSKLSAEVQELFKEMTNVTLLKEVVKQSIIGELKKKRFLKNTPQIRLSNHSADLSRVNSSMV